MTAVVTPEDRERARELTATIREAMLYLVDKDSVEIRRMLPQALAAVEAQLPGHAALRLAGDSIRLLAEGRHDRQIVIGALDRYDRALAEAHQPVIAVKLVIWDLDDTFWRGTLAEGDVLAILPEHVEMVRELTRRGIVNSICSKNDPVAARARLEAAGVWEHFVFPRIAFAPKGELIRDIIEQAQLRAENVLFVDDNSLNLEEARYYNPGLQTLDARQLPTLLDLPGLAGKPDGGQRLAQYRMLEQRASERGQASSNEAFLRESDIRLRIIPTGPADAERVHDLLTRTNQLNFTKVRLSREEVESLIADSARETAAIAVRDRFGDHGVVGWYCLHQGRLEHFLFSCRIINLGIEQFVYAHLGRPLLEVVGETASSPFKAAGGLDYITLDTGPAPCAGAEAVGDQPASHPRLALFALGACDMYYLVGNLANSLTEVVFECNTFRGDTRGVNVATEYLRSCFEMTEGDKAFCARHFHNYTGQTAFRTRILDGHYDYALLSFNDDAELFIHRHRENPALRVVLSESASYSVTPVIPPPGEDADRWLSEHFCCEGQITPERFRANLLWLAERMPSSTRLLLMTLPEFNYYRDSMPSFPQYRRQCLRLNRVIRDLCAGDDRFGLVEMNRHITDRSHFTDYLMHLSPERGFRIACEALEQMAARPVSTDLLASLPTRGRRIALVGGGLEILPIKWTLAAAGVDVSICASLSSWSGMEDDGVLPIKEVVDMADTFFAIVTPEFGAIGPVLKEMGYVEGRDGWVLPRPAFNLDWKER